MLRPTVTADAQAYEEALTEYLGGGDAVAERVEASFGPVDPFRRLPHGIQSVVEALAQVSTDPSEYPPLDGDELPISAIMLGRLVAMSSLAAADKNDIQDFMQLVRPQVVAHFIKARARRSCRKSERAPPLWLRCVHLMHAR